VDVTLWLDLVGKSDAIEDTDYRNIISTVQQLVKLLSLLW